MEIEISNKTKSKIDLMLVEKVAREFLKKYKKNNYGLSIAFIGDKEIKAINKKYRKIDKITDVLSFEENSGSVSLPQKFLGEILIDYQQIKRQAKKSGVSINEELVFILVHGLLHLLGYNDETEDELDKMKEIGRKFIKENNWPLS